MFASSRKVRRIAVVFLVLAALLAFGATTTFAQGVTGTVTTTVTVTGTRAVTATTAPTGTAVVTATRATTSTAAATPSQLPGTGSDSGMTVWPLVAVLGLAAFAAGGLLLRRSNSVR